MADPLNGGQRTRFIVSGDSAVVDPGTADGADIPVELRPARELSAYLADVPIRATDALVPAGDVIPAALIDTLVTEHGATAAVTPTAVAALGGVDASAD
jgi:methylthioribose-1-phosphate isomerase